MAATRMIGVSAGAVPDVDDRDPVGVAARAPTHGHPTPRGRGSAPKPYAPDTRMPGPKILLPKPYTRNPTPETLNPDPYTWNPKSENPHLTP